VTDGVATALPLINRGDVSRHILPTSATMVGVCVTVVSLVRLMEVTGHISTVIDNVMAFDSILFLGSSVLSYLSLRTAHDTRVLERYADILFLAGLVLVVVASFMLAWEFGHVIAPPGLAVGDPRAIPRP